MNCFYCPPFLVKDYYPFGMLMPGRNFSSENYHFGFNGKIEDDEVNGNGNSIDFGARIYDPRLGRWASIEPYFKKMPQISTYSSFDNNPIYMADPTGKDGKAEIKKAEPLVKGRHTYQGGTLQNPHSITITAKFYYNSTSMHYEGAVDALDKALSEYNKSDYVVQASDGNYYNVKFDLTAVPVEESIHKGNLQEINQKYAMNDNAAIDANSYFPFGNVIGADILDPDPNSKELGSANRKYISLSTPKIDEVQTLGYPIAMLLKEIFKHEIGHNLGAVDNSGGVMEQQKFDTGEKQIQSSTSAGFKSIEIHPLNKSNVLDIVNSIFKDRDPEAPGKVHLTNPN